MYNIFDKVVMTPETNRRTMALPQVLGVLLVLWATPLAFGVGLAVAVRVASRAGVI